MKKLTSSNSNTNTIQKLPKSTGTTPSVAPTLSENGDVQFTSTGNALVDLVSRGADTLLQKANQADVKRYVGLVKAAFAQDAELTKKIIRYFRDRARGQGLKEQPTLAMAILDGNLSVEEITNILTVHNSPDTEGAQELNRIDFLDLVRILAWHKYLNGRDSKLSYAMCQAMAQVIASNEEALSQVLRIKNRNLQYDTNNKKQVGIVDILGIVRNLKSVPIPEEVKAEYEGHLYPRHRGQKYNAEPVHPIAVAQRNFFKHGGEVPNGITFEKILSRGNDKEIRYMLINNRISTTQLKVNLATALRLLSPTELKAVYEKHKFKLFPHEILAMGKAFIHGTTYTTANKAGADFVNMLLQSSIEDYKKRVTKNVLFLGDVSGSMSGPIAQMSTIMQREFGSFMSFFSSHVSGQNIWGSWGGDAYLWESNKTPTIHDFLSAKYNGNVDTNIEKAVRTTADYFISTGRSAPDVIAIISDMQFNFTEGTTNSHPYYKDMRGGGMSISAINNAKTYYKQRTGKDVEVVYWNVNANTVPEISQTGIMTISGFSANTADLVFGIINQSSEKPSGKMDPTDLIKWIDQKYK